MRVRCDWLFPGEVLEAVLVSAPSQVSRTERVVVLELIGPAPIQISPPAVDAIVVEATPAEWEALRAAGYELQSAS
jgi:hypothetical protein